MARIACLVCLISTSSGCSTKSQNVLERCGASCGHITKFELSIFFRYQCYKHKEYTKYFDPENGNIIHSEHKR
jgi:hypothetical protein